MIMSLSPSASETCLLSIEDKQSTGDNEVAMKKTLGLINGVSFIIGGIVGTGIFISPAGVLREAGSVGLALVIWVSAGAFSMIGALCYTELGTTFQQSGGEFTYLKKCFGELPAFLWLWIHAVAVGPAGNAITALTFAYYVLEPFFGFCEVPPNAVRAIAALTLCFLTYVNCKNVKWAANVQIAFTFAKIVALVIIIIAGLYYMLIGHTESFQNAFKGTTKRPGRIALSFYSGFYAFSGWYSLNYITEELKDPTKNLPRSIYISLPVVTAVYILVNVAYLVVLSPYEILSSNAVAVAFGDRVLGVMSWIMPFSVALSSFGSINGSLFGSSRIFFVGAREGHLPVFLSMINLQNCTPTPSLVFYCMMSLVYLFTTEVYVLINYIGFITYIFMALSLFGMVWMRYKQPDLKRPIKVNLMLPLTFLIISVCLITFPVYVKPWETCMGLALLLTGLPVYAATVHWQNKPSVYKRTLVKFTQLIQKLLLSVQEENLIERDSGKINQHHQMKERISSAATW